MQSTNKTRWVQSQKHPDSDCFSVLTPLWPWLKHPPLQRRQLHLAPQFLPPWADNSPTRPVSQVLMASCMAVHRPRLSLTTLAQCHPSYHRHTVGVHPQAQGLCPPQRASPFHSYRSLLQFLNREALPGCVKRSLVSVFCLQRLLYLLPNTHDCGMSAGPLLEHVIPKARTGVLPAAFRT